MNIEKTAKCSCLPKSSRVNEKIIEYYTKFGKDRDIEKFMRLHSPRNKSCKRNKSCGAIHSSRETSSGETSGSTGSAGKMLKGLILNSSQSGSSKNSKAESSSSVELNVAEKKVDSTSQEDSFETPNKPNKSLTESAKTPDSLIKMHKRLEWDSLGDIGYMKSMSTSNISILERRILRGFFQEASSYSSSSNKQTGNVSDGDLQTKVRKKLFLNSHQLRKQITADANTPPLASSTVLESKGIKTGDSAPKNSTKETNTNSLPKYQEQYIQTSLVFEPSRHSQEVQVNMSGTSYASATDSSSIATQSSQEYTYVSHQNDNLKTRNKPNQDHLFITKINKMFSQRRTLMDRDQCQRREETKPIGLANVNITEKFLNTLIEDKENALKLPRLDLGIQLLCSLFDANSLTNREKKQLLREIMKRITQLGLNKNNETSETEASGKGTKNLKKSSSSSGKDERLIRTIVYGSNSEKSESTTYVQKSKEDQSTINETSSSRLNSHKSSNDISTHLSIASKLSSMETETQSKEVSNKNSHSTTSSSFKDLTAEKKSHESCYSDASMNEWLNPMTQSEIEYEQRRLERLAAKKTRSKRSFEAQSQAEKERETQLNWIESEIQRLESLKNLLLEENSKDNNSESAEHFSKSNMRAQHKETNNKNQYESDNSSLHKLDENGKTSNVGKKSGENAMQEIEVIIEESNEEEINFKTNFKRTKDRKRETQITFHKPSVEMGSGEKPTGTKPQFRTMKETIITQEDQVISANPTHQVIPPVRQRSKIDTPTNSNDTDSVCSFVLQRKREFMDHYKNRKKSQCHADAEPKKGKLQQQLHRLQQQPQQSHSQCTWQSIQQLSTSHRQQSRSEPQSTTTSDKYSTSIGLISSQSNNYNNSLHVQTSSSAFAISSEVSIPMRSNPASSSTNTTTTHQYDEVATTAPTATVPSTAPHKSVDTEEYRKGSKKEYSLGTQVKPTSIAYTINFNDNAEIIQNSQLSLQQQLQVARPKFCADSRERKAVLNKIQALRQERERKLRDIIENTSLQSLDRKLNTLPPPPIKHTRVISTKEMKAMTNKKYTRLPEVLTKQENEREERRRRGNRLLRDIFNKRLQKRVRDGKLTLNHSRTVI